MCDKRERCWKKSAAAPWPRSLFLRGGVSHSLLAARAHHPGHAPPPCPLRETACVRASPRKSNTQQLYAADPLRHGPRPLARARRQCGRRRRACLLGRGRPAPGRLLPGGPPAIHDQADQQPERPVAVREREMDRGEWAAAWEGAAIGKGAPSARSPPPPPPLWPGAARRVGLASPRLAGHPSTRLNGLALQAWAWQGPVRAARSVRAPPRVDRAWEGAAIERETARERRSLSPLPSVPLHALPSQCLLPTPTGRRVGVAWSRGNARRGEAGRGHSALEEE